MFTKRLLSSASRSGGSTRTTTDSPLAAALAASSGSQSEASLGIWRGDGENRRAELAISGGIAPLVEVFEEVFDGELYGGFVL